MPFVISVGPFDLERPIGKGGMGEVWWAIHRQQRLSVAVKLLTSAAAQKPRFRAAFRNEVRAVAGLDHPHIVRVFDYGEVDAAAAEASQGQLRAGTPYLAMELVADGTLMKLRGRVKWHELREVLRGLLDALAHAHARGVVHRDIKPGNVLLGRRDPNFRRGLQIKLTDFGLAHAVDADEPIQEGSYDKMSGTPHYMAPEQFRGLWRDYGPWTDLYALGCLVWAVLHGEPLYGKGLRTPARALAHLTEPVPELTTDVELPEGFEAWLRSLLAKDPANRFQRAADAAWGLMQLDDSGLIESAPALPAPGEDFDSMPTLVGSAFHAAVTGWVSEEQTTRIFSQTDLPQIEHTAEGQRIVRPSAPPVPASWRRRIPPRPSMKLVGAGLGLYGLRDIPLVGREQERNALWSALRRTDRSRRPEVVLLRGPSGCGKSRLARWVTARSHEVGAATVLRATHAAIPGSATGLGAMLSRHLGCVGLDREGSLQRVERVLRRQGVDDDNEWLALTEWMAPASAADIEGGARTIRFASAEERYIALFRELTRLAQDRAVVLWLDDVQWGLDALQLTLWLLEQPQPLRVLVVLTTMEEALAGAAVQQSLVDAIAGHERATELAIGPLDPEHRPVLVQQLLGLEGALARQVEARTAGNPLFAVQLVGDWVERGLLEPGEHGFRLVGKGLPPLPDDIHEVWAHRVAAVLEGRSKPEERALEVAAVLGGTIDPDEWMAISNTAGGDASPQLLDALLTHHLAEPEADGWRFVHGMVRESVERRAREQGRLRTLHRLCANHLERQGGPGRRERLGRHLVAAGDHEAALQPLFEGARERVASGDYSVSESLLGERERALTALGLGHDDERWAEGWLLRYQIAARRVRYDEAGTWLERADEAAREHQLEDLSAQVAMWRGHLARLYGEPGRSADLLAQAVPRVANLGDVALRARARNELGEACAEAGRLADARRWTELARRDHESLGDEVGVGHSVRNLGEIVKVEGDHREAARLMWQAEAIFAEHGDRWARASTLNSLGDVNRYLGDFAEAERLYRLSGELFRAVGSGSAIYPEYNMALAMLERGRIPDARAVFSRVLGVFEQQGRVTATADCHLGLAGCAAAVADWERWQLHVGKALSMSDGTGSADEDTARLAEVVAGMTAAAGKGPLATAVYQHALENWRALGRDEEATRVLGVLAELG